MSDDALTPEVLDDDDQEVKVYSLPHTVHLRKPVKVFSVDGELLEEHKSLTFKRRPVAGDLMATDKLGDVGRGLKLISLLTGTPMSIVKRVDPGDDLGELSEVLASFF